MPDTHSSHSDPAAQRPLHIDVVCTGNICRSPMGEVIIRHFIEDAGLSKAATVTSCGLGGWHVGDSADERALRELSLHGYDGSQHRASQFGQFDADADLLIAMDTGHVSRLIASGVPESKIRLLRSFDPDSPEQSSVEDPYYGGAEGFSITRQQIEAAVPGILDWIRTHPAFVE
ncbi:protein tyrosine phosphatase [Corynebacterium sp. 3HC-13]|uniref:low molecular weight protein-tyrosine-phosphatase n=1 Tax=Corynebacterium poyangense TaxID=2684405 RepID=UPI001CCA697A|nr:low molecular weight protein-tyrosine-phosphatase [Corynebacterium poyangense]MBZ8178456.1 protein tyrosine phosphatase [Corynebacterium poyangense]